VAPVNEPFVWPNNSLSKIDVLGSQLAGHYDFHALPQQFIPAVAGQLLRARVHKNNSALGIHL
jgi:hypothetical protein